MCALVSWYARVGAPPASSGTGSPAGGTPWAVAPSLSRKLMAFLSLRCTVEQTRQPACAGLTKGRWRDILSELAKTPGDRAVRRDALDRNPLVDRCRHRFVVVRQRDHLVDRQRFLQVFDGELA